MNAALEKAIIERLHTLDDVLLAEVFDFVEFLEYRKKHLAAPLTGLFAVDNADTANSGQVREALDDLRRDRDNSLEQTTAFVESTLRGRDL